MVNFLTPKWKSQIYQAMNPTTLGVHNIFLISHLNQNFTKETYSFWKELFDDISHFSIGNDWTLQSVIEVVGNQLAIWFSTIQMNITYATILVLRMSQLHCIILQELSNGLMKAQFRQGLNNFILLVSYK
jgi:hypothetical protein